jgi:BASS family bile acid:Na+ symporter
MDLTAVTWILTATFLVVTMLGIGLRLAPSDDRAAMARRPVLVLAVVSLVVVPLVGAAIASAIPLSDAATFALLALACAPAGTVGPKLVQMAGGDLRLAVIVAFGLSAIATLTVAPSLVLASGVLGLDAAVATIRSEPIIARLVVFQLVPLLVGMALLRRRPALAGRLVEPATRLSSGLLAAVVVVALADGWRYVLALGPLPFLAGSLLLVAADSLGWLAGGPAPEGRRTGLLITGQRSGALALLVAIGMDWPAASAAVVALALVNLVGNTAVAVVIARGLPVRRAAAGRGGYPFIRTG